VIRVELTETNDESGDAKGSHATTLRVLLLNARHVPRDVLDLRCCSGSELASRLKLREREGDGGNRKCIQKRSPYSQSNDVVRHQPRGKREE
jgi:hypothetical protein